MVEPKTVDVVIPCYNYGRFLSHCVTSVLSQPGVNVRVCIIDDASTDDSLAIAMSIAETNPRVEVIAHATNMGHISTYNEGLLGWSTGDYVVLLSADDMLAPGSLARAGRFMDDHPSVGMVYGHAVPFTDHDALPSRRLRPGKWNTWKGHEWASDRCASGHNVISSPEVVVRGEIQRAVGGYRSQFPHAGDLEMWLRIAAVSDIAYVRGVPQAFYRKHGNNMSWSHAGIADLRQRKAVFDSFCDEHTSTMKDAAGLKRSANEALAREALWAAARAYDRGRPDYQWIGERVAFAAEAYDAYETLPECRALARRTRLGPEVCHRTQVFAVSAAYRRFKRWLVWHRWKRMGY